MLSEQNMKNLATVMMEMSVRPDGGISVLDVFYDFYGNEGAARRSVEHVAVTFLKIAQDYDAGSWEGD